MLSVYGNVITSIIHVFRDLIVWCRKAEFGVRLPIGLLTLAGAVRRHFAPRADLEFLVRTLHHLALFLKALPCPINHGLDIQTLGWG